MILLPFFPNNLLYGAPESSIGLCTLWTPRSRYERQRPHAAIIGNLYSRFGIGLLMRNVLATPSIRILVVTGRDNPEPTRQNGHALITQELDPADLSLTLDQIHEFYRRVILVDNRDLSVRYQDALTERLRSYTPPVGPLPEPLVIPLPEVQHDLYPTSRSGHLIRAEDIPSAHAALLAEIRRHGSLTPPDSEGHRRQELWQLTVCLPPTCPLTTPMYTSDEIQRYGDALWNGDEPADLTYRYGHTLRYRYGDQIQATLDAFRKKPETFRTVLSLWEPLGSMLRDDEPCLTLVHPRIREGMLDMFAYIRTNEMYTGWPKNAGGLRVFQTYMSQALDVPVGELTIGSGSAHLYDYAWPQVDTLLATQIPRRPMADPKGDWAFSQDDQGYHAIQTANGTVLQMFTTPTVDALERRIRPYLSSTSHALYIGRALERLTHG